MGGPDPGPVLTPAGLKDLAGGVLGVDFLDDALQDAVFVKDEGAAERAERGLAVHLLLAPGTEGLEHLGRRIGEEPEGQLVPGAEAGVGFCGVFAHAHDVVPGFHEGRVIVPETARFGCAAGGVVLGVKIDDGLAAAADEVFGLYGLSVLVNHFEVGHGVSDLKHRVII